MLPNMGDAKGTGRGQLHGGNVKDRSKRNALSGRRRGGPEPTNLNARPEMHLPPSKHESYYEIVENENKKQKLEFEVTSDQEPPPGYEFVPMGNPDLTKACKELSREKGAMIFIVSIDKRAEPGSLSEHISRVGHHIRESIVETVRKSMGGSAACADHRFSGVPEPIPESQEEINEQADKAIRDLFPRIPNTDRHTIIEHSFKKGANKKGEPLVGLAPNISLSRRVQLAVLAHIRHTHTRYDQLLKETTYINARKAVEELCLDVLVKWRGDEETGRDQLDEILREVIVISDSEDGDDDDADETDETDESDEDDETSGKGTSLSDDQVEIISCIPLRANRIVQLEHRDIGRHSAGMRYTTEEPAYDHMQHEDINPPSFVSGPSRVLERSSFRKGRRGFGRYEAALKAAVATRWAEAKERVQQHEYPSGPRFAAEPLPAVQREASPPRPPFYIIRSRSHTEQPENRVAVQDTGPSFGYRDEPVCQATHNPPDDQRHGSHTYGQRHAPSPAPLAGGWARPSDGDVTGHAEQPLLQGETVRFQEGQNYLVPSVEPGSLGPRVEQRVPIFVRTVSPRLDSREVHPDQLLRRYEKRHSPSWRVGDHYSGKRRRIAFDAEAVHGPIRPEPEPVYTAYGQQPHHYVESRASGPTLVAIDGNQNQASALDVRDSYSRAPEWQVQPPRPVGQPVGQPTFIEDGLAIYEPQPEAAPHSSYHTGQPPRALPILVRQDIYNRDGNMPGDRYAIWDDGDTSRQRYADVGHPRPRHDVENWQPPQPLSRPSERGRLASPAQYDRYFGNNVVPAPRYEQAGGYDGYEGQYFSTPPPTSVVNVESRPLHESGDNWIDLRSPEIAPQSRPSPDVRVYPGHWQEQHPHMPADIHTAHDYLERPEYSHFPPNQAHPPPPPAWNSHGNYR